MFRKERDQKIIRRNPQQTKKIPFIKVILMSCLISCSSAETSLDQCKFAIISGSSTVEMKSFSKLHFNRRKNIPTLNLSLYLKSDDGWGEKKEMVWVEKGLQRSERERDMDWDLKEVECEREREMDWRDDVHLRNQIKRQLLSGCFLPTEKDFLKSFSSQITEHVLNGQECLLLLTN